MNQILVILAVAGYVSASAAATLSVTPDKSTYAIGETVTLSVSGDDQGATSYGVFGRLLYNGSLVDNGTRSQIRLVGPNGNWITNVLNQGDTNANTPNSAFSYAFNQFSGNPAQTANNLPAVNPFSTVTLIAKATGIVNVSWDATNPGFQMMFFGLSDAPGTSFTIVPEPATAVLCGLGLTALALARRRSSNSP